MTNNRMPLSLEYAIKNKLKTIECIKYFRSNWTDSYCDFYLWEMTPYPFVSISQLIEFLNDKFIKK